MGSVSSSKWKRHTLIYLLTCLLACACSFLFRMLFVNFFACSRNEQKERMKQKNNNNVIEPLFSTWALISWARKIDFGKFSSGCELMDEDNYVIKKSLCLPEMSFNFLFFFCCKIERKIKRMRHFLERDFLCPFVFALL